MAQFRDAHWPAGGEPERVSIDSLRPSDSPRLDGESTEHVRTLAASGASLPPIVIHRATMRVVDGMHRVGAAILRGEDEILGHYYEGSEDDAFIMGVEANIAHGLPLSTADRTAAAERIIVARPQWSDRRIAAVSGLAATTVGALRRRSTGRDGQSNSAPRVGIDGRARPFDAAAGRIAAGELITSRPDASIREIAAAAGISPSTVLDVRRRLRNGEDPLPKRQRAAAGAPPKPGQHTDAGSSRQVVAEVQTIMRRLRKDPSLSLNDAGRMLLRWLDAHNPALRDWERYLNVVPAHNKRAIAELARMNALVWEEFATQLDCGS
ncbi:ParB/RepB/Spo0J family partition protein [Amycolatopsis solani]|uniref:ParB/RepB/Spo0J family partition protein n=1 Tax=Amycolatopsis solani TaxID=3028615 RepID=UPI0025B0C80A|nr:ParB/RepB/Spo0J family partition protein [Amycolatopsis sp. MEP2-6]